MFITSYQHCFYLAASQDLWFSWFTRARQALQTFQASTQGDIKTSLLDREKNKFVLCGWCHGGLLLPKSKHSSCVKIHRFPFCFNFAFSFFFKHNSHFHLCVSVTHLQVFPLPLFWNVDCESHSLRFWLPFKVRHIAHSKTGCTSINQSWRHHYKVLLIASMGMGAYSLRQSDSSRHTEIGWINSPSSSLYWTSLLITLLLF